LFDNDLIEPCILQFVISGRCCCAVILWRHEVDLLAGNKKLLAKNSYPFTA